VNGSVMHLVEQLSDVKYDPVRRQTYIALDVPAWEEAARLVNLFGPAVDGYKVGMELYYAAGADAVRRLVDAGKRVFLDLKLHDIPNTVRGGLTSLTRLGVEMVNVHALGGRKALEAAREAAEAASRRPLVVAVTLLTSLSAADLTRAGVPCAPADLVESLTRLAVEAGLDGVVASAREIERVRQVAPAGFEIVVPGTRPVGASHDDQARSLTPGEAVMLGATRLVLGRAVTRAQGDMERLQALGRVWEEMLAALGDAGQTVQTAEGRHGT
jgi:orotidine-5'-phosphate decarboxylase